MNYSSFRCIKFFIVCFIFVQHAVAQKKNNIVWSSDGSSYTKVSVNGIVKVDTKTQVETSLINKERLTPPGASTALTIASYSFSASNKKVLIFTNTAKVWRYNTRGDYWVLDIASNKLVQIGRGLPSQSLMFAKFSPDAEKVAYVSEHNLYVETLSNGRQVKLTSDGTRKLINGTFDWVYEEEFGCRDGFRWSPDGSKIAFWQVDATKIRDYYMLNTTDSVYSKVIPVEYPKVGQAPSPVRIGVIYVSSGNLKWMNIEGDPQQHYLSRMEWASNNELVVQQLDRKQQESKLIYCSTVSGDSYTFWAEDDEAWVDMNTDNPIGWNWINNGQDFIWVSEKDGWRHIYKISRDGKKETLLTNNNFDIGEIKCIDENNNYIYFTASPGNATQLYLYKIHIEQKSNNEDAQIVTPISLKGSHGYDISPNGKYAYHTFSNYKTPLISEWISLPDHKSLSSSKSIASNIKEDNNKHVDYIQITTEDDVTVDAWINKPDNFNPQKKYPVVFYVYGEPGASTVNDFYGNHDNFLYKGNMAADGYIQVSMDNRGTPSLKGKSWRKSIYRKIGKLNIKDMAMVAKKILQFSYCDKERVAVWGWSGGGSSTLNLMFQYPDIFKTGISIAAISNLLFYDNIYQERYMGLPQENKQDFIDGSPLTYVKGLKGNLLYMHGTGDDNVHYSNAEVLLNELIKYNKQFQFMAYPNRTHNISEGEGTFMHLSTLYTNFLQKNCPPGAK